MTEKIFRKYLEIKSLEDFNEVKKLSENYSVDLVKPNDFQLNKFFYKSIGKDHYWKDRLIWNDFYWMDYVVSIERKDIAKLMGKSGIDVNRRYARRRSWSNLQDALKDLGPIPIMFVYSDNKLTNRGFEICK